MKKKWVSVFLCCMLTVCGNAQTEGYHYFADIDSIKNPGFYKIGLGPELNAHIKADFSDVRIVNNAGKWIPHILTTPGEENNVGITALNIGFTKLSNGAATTELILTSPDIFISAFDINVRSTSASRVAKLSGSDNRLDWFVIIDSLLLTPISTEEKGETKYHIEFPAAKYKYYKVVIDNKVNDPVNIIGVTTPLDANVVTDSHEFSVADNPESAVFQKDSGKISFVRVTNRQNYHIEHLALTVSGVKYYYRKLEIYLPSAENHSFSNPGTLLRSFYITNKSALYFTLPHVNPRIFYLLIYNEDNLPLKIDGIKTSSDTRTVMAYLEKGKSYKLIMDNPSATMPDYDLTKLKNIIPDSVQFLETGKIKPFEEKKSVISTEKNNKWFLWTAIAVAIIILLFFTQKMLSEVNKRKAA